MKIEITKKFPDYFKPLYEQEFELFSHLETTCAVPHVLFAITTWKENGMPNVCLHSWSCFHGDKNAFFAVLGCLYQHTHTFSNIKRTQSFCINFLPVKYYDRLVDTINHNGMDDDEFKVGGFSLERGKAVDAPTIKEAFINMECSLKQIQDLSGSGITSMVIGEVVSISVDEEYAKGHDKRCGHDGFMMLVPSAQNLITGEPNPSVIATLKIDRLD